MKEAAGEANMTVITIVLIAIVLGVGTIIVNNMMESSKYPTMCATLGGTWNSTRQECIDPEGRNITPKIHAEIKKEKAGLK